MKDRENIKREMKLRFRMSLGRSSSRRRTHGSPAFFVIHASRGVAERSPMISKFDSPRIKIARDIFNVECAVIDAKNFFQSLKSILMNGARATFLRRHPFDVHINVKQ